MGELKAHDAARRFHSTVAWENRHRRGDFNLGVLLLVVVMRNGVHEALLVDLVLEDGVLVPSLVDGGRVKVAELGVGVDLHLAEDELPAGEAAHGADKPHRGIVRLDDLTFPLAFERPRLIAVVCHFGVEDEQLDELFVAVISVRVQYRRALTAAVHCPTMRLLSELKNDVDSKLTFIDFLFLVGVRVGLVLLRPLPVRLDDFSQKMAQLELGRLVLVILQVMVFAVHPLRVNLPVLAHEKVGNVDFRVVVALDLVADLNPGVAVVVR